MGDEPAQERQVRRDALDFRLPSAAATWSNASGLVAPWAMSFAIMGS